MFVIKILIVMISNKKKNILGQRWKKKLVLIIGLKIMVGLIVLENYILININVLIGHIEIKDERKIKERDMIILL